jgi:hypothetical protein
VLAQVPDLAGDLDDLLGMGEPEPTDRDRLEREYALTNVSAC